jgi:hypothetical protein
MAFIGAFIAERMRMSPIDQPLMLLQLLGRHSPAPYAGRGPADPGKRRVGHVLIRKIGRTAQPSKILAADQLLD